MTAAEVRRRPWRRLFVTLGSAAVVALGSQITLPGIDTELLAAMGAGRGMVSLFSLGLTPVFASAVLVELVALLVPDLRRIRLGSPEERQRLGRATAYLSMLFAALQGAGVAVHLQSMPSELANPGALWTIVATVSLMAGTFALLGVATLISRHGLGHGFVVVALVGTLGELFGRPAAPSPAAIALAVLSLLITVVLAAAVLRRRAAHSDDAPGLRLLAGGINPLVVTSSLLFLPATITGVVAPAQLSWAEGLAFGPARLGAEVGLVLVLSLACAWLFSRPALIAGVAERAYNRPCRPDLAGLLLWPALLSMALGVWVVGIDACTAALGVPLKGAVAIVAAAALLDLVSEWRARTRQPDLVEVWALHQVQAGDLVAHALGKAGIPVHLRSLAFRSLWHFFAPYVPIAVMVPRAQADQARSAIEPLLLGRSRRGRRRNRSRVCPRPASRRHPS